MRKITTETLMANVYVYDPPAKVGSVSCSRTDGGSWSALAFKFDSGFMPIDNRAWELMKPAIDRAFDEVRAAMENDRTAP